MPLELFALITPLGIAMIVLIVRYCGLSKTSQIKSRQEAIEIFRQDFAGENFSNSAIVSSDRKAAFIEMNEPGHVGLVESVGDRFITRLLEPGDISSLKQQGNNAMSISFHDFTHPNGHYEFENSQAMSTLFERLTKLEKSK